MSMNRADVPRPDPASTLGLQCLMMRIFGNGCSNPNLLLGDYPKTTYRLLGEAFKLHIVHGDVVRLAACPPQPQHRRWP